MTEQEILLLMTWGLASLIGVRMLACLFFHWHLSYIKHKVKREIARQEGVSLEYVNEVIANSDKLIEGKITSEEFIEQVIRIAYKYPKDTNILLEREH